MAYSKARRLADIMSTSAGIPTASIQDNAITSAKIGVDVIVAEDLAANAVTVSEITDDAVTQAKIADQAIDEARMQISNAGTNGQFLSKQSGNTGGLTWADATLWSETTEGLVTTTQGQDNVDFTIPADVNRIKVMFWSLSQVSNTNEFEIRVGTTDGTVHTSNYKNTSWYMATSAQSVSESTDGIYLIGWNSTSNYWYGSLDMECLDTDKRRWFYSWTPYNDTYGEYLISGNGKLDCIGSGQQLRKIRFTSAGGDGYDSGCLMRVYTAQV